MWISLHIYIRVFMERPSYVLEDLLPYVTEEHIIIFALFIFVHVLYTITSIFLIYRQIFPSKRYVLGTYISENITKLLEHVYWKPLEYIHDLIAPHIPMSGRFFVYLEKIWSKKGYMYFYTLIFLFEALPRILIASVFLIEVVFFGQVKVFLQVISLILIPIAWHIFLKLFANCGKINLPVIKQYFETIKGIGNPTLDTDGKIVSYKSYEFIIKSDYEDIIDPEESALLLLQFEAMPRFVEQLKKDSAKLMPYVTFITSLIYVIGGLYRLIYFLV